MNETDSVRITNLDDSAIFPVYLIKANGQEVPLAEFSKEMAVSLPLGGSQRLRVRFNPLIPTLTGKTTGLSANQVLPEEIHSRLSITTGVTQPQTIDLTGSISPAVRLIHPIDPRLDPLVTINQSGDEFIVEYTIFDPNLDVMVAQYEFLDSNNKILQPTSNIDFGDTIKQAGIVKGQALRVIQRFLNASTLPQTARVRVRVFDSQSDTAVSLPINTDEPRTTTVSAASYSETRLASETIAPSAQVWRRHPKPPSICPCRRRSPGPRSKSETGQALNAQLRSFSPHPDRSIT